MRPRLLGCARPGVADLVTLGNAACGVLSVLYTATHVWQIGPNDAARVLDVLRPAIALVILGTVFDVADGLVARRFGHTLLGRPLDAMADAVTFGIAPAVLFGAATLRVASSATDWLVVVAVVAYLAGALLRLAAFAAEEDRPANYTGLPSPLAAACALAALVLNAPSWVSALLVIAVAALMVSRIRYPVQQGVTRIPTLLAWALALVAALGLLGRTAPPLITLSLVLVVVPGLDLLRMRRMAAAPDTASREPAGVTPSDRVTADQRG